jgi:glutamyl-tRNA synthetase
MTDSTTSAGAAPDVRTGPRLRFCPSPTGAPHVGLMRTALTNFAHARATNGTLVFRIEDTDAARDTEDSYRQLLEAMTWLGITWDEGVEVGGPFGPYRQSERREIYDDVLRRLIEAGYVYESYTSAAEVEARHLAAGRDPKLGYDNVDRELSEAQRAAYRAEGRVPVYRFRMPDADLTFVDAVRGPVTFKTGSTPDFVVARAGGEPLYTLTNPVDDALMRIDLVLRGEDLLASTPRQLPLHAALVELGLSDRIPEYGHLPIVIGEGNRKLSKRDPRSMLWNLRDLGFLPEGLDNYLMLLGWSLAPDRDVFTMAEAIRSFDVHDVIPSPARFDLAKATAINGDHIRLLAADDYAERLVPYLQRAGVLADPPTTDQLALLAAAAPLVQTRMALLSEAPDLLAFLFVDASHFALDEAAAKLVGDDNGQAVLVTAADTLAGMEPDGWTVEAIEGALRAALVEGMGLKPRLAFGPIRAAVTGRRVSPPLFESMELLGSTESLRRIEAARLASASPPQSL